VFTKFSETVEELKKDLPGAEAPTQTVVGAAEKRKTAVLPPNAEPAAAPVQVVETSKVNPMGLVQYLIAPLLGPLGTAALVVLLVIFMLLRREDLRRRLIRLIGKGRISVSTHAMADAGARVFRYLLMQLVVNVSYGIPVAIGLYFIGVPNAVLWGAFATVLRFIPYIGPWIGAAMPVALSLAVSPSWTMPLLTIGLFVLLELLSNNVMEPWLYGSSTGVTPIALIVAAVFWTWLWGPVGLILSTPLTVCLVVMGRHVPRLSFLSILLSDEEALTPAEDCYHRLLTVSEQDELEFVEAYLKVNSLTALYDSVFIPVIICDRDGSQARSTRRRAAIAHRAKPA
jgi:predicted PurR-regulated permease PerM